jgi:hypothetical protein
MVPTVEPQCTTNGEIINNIVYLPSHNAIKPMNLATSLYHTELNALIFAQHMFMKVKGKVVPVLN